MKSQTTMEGQPTMTVGELMDELAKYPREAAVEIPVSQYNKRYPIGYLPVESVTARPDQFGGGARIESSLPRNMRTSVLKGDQFLEGGAR